MKKIIFIIMLLTAAFSFAQENWQPRQNNRDGKYDQMKSPGGDTTALNVWDQSAQHKKTASPNLFTLYKSTAAEADSAEFGFTSFKIFIYNDAANSSNDTLYLSSSLNFPSSATIKLIGSEWRELAWAVEKLYYKFGFEPAADKLLRLEAN